MTQGVGKEQKALDLGKAISELIVKTEEQALYIMELHSKLEALEAKVKE